MALDLHARVLVGFKCVLCISATIPHTLAHIRLCLATLYLRSKGYALADNVTFTLHCSLHLFQACTHNTSVLNDCQSRARLLDAPIHSMSMYTTAHAIAVTCAAHIRGQIARALAPKQTDWTDYKGSTSRAVSHPANSEQSAKQSTCCQQVRYPNRALPLLLKCCSSTSLPCARHRCLHLLCW